MTPVPLWRRVAGGLVLGVLVAFAILFTPSYLRNQELQQYVAAMTRSVENRTKPDGELRQLVLMKAQQLRLPVTEDNVHVLHGPEGLRIDVRYAVRVDLPGYSVALHFYPGAGSR